MTLEINGLSRSFGGIPALRNISLTIESGSLVCFLGPSGCGKTTLLRSIAGLVQPDSGTISLDGEDLSTLAPNHRNFGMVFQSYSLFPSMTAAKNVGYGLRIRKWPPARIDERVGAMLKMVNLQDHGEKLPGQLSGGQQQRIALARALAINPRLLLLDEPLSALDAKVREDLRSEIRSLQRELGITTIMVTHDQDEALSMADSIVVMRDGIIEQVGAPSDIYHAPQTAFVAGFIGRMNIFERSREAGDMPAFDGHRLTLDHISPDVRRVAIRPEDVELCEIDDGRPNVVIGTIKEITFCGSYFRIALAPHAGSSRAIFVDHHRREANAAVGDVAGVHLPARHMRALP